MLKTTEGSLQLVAMVP